MFRGFGVHRGPALRFGEARTRSWPCDKSSRSSAGSSQWASSLVDAANATNPEWQAEFDAAARRRPLAQRMRQLLFAPISSKLDDAEYRALTRHRGVPALVRAKLAGMAGVWPRLPAGVRSATYGTPFGACSSASPVPLAFPTTQDADVFVERTPENGCAPGRRPCEPSFAFTDGQAAGRRACAISSTKTNLRLRPDLSRPMDRALRVWNRHVEVEGFFVCHPDDIIASKEATGRRKD